MPRRADPERLVGEGGIKSGVHGMLSKVEEHPCKPTEPLPTSSPRPSCRWTEKTYKQLQTNFRGFVNVLGVEIVDEVGPDKREGDEVEIEDQNVSDEVHSSEELQKAFDMLQETFQAMEDEIDVEGDYGDGAEFQAAIALAEKDNQTPYEDLPALPQRNISNYPQDMMTGIRGRKFSLAILFSSECVLDLLNSDDFLNSSV